MYIRDEKQCIVCFSDRFQLDVLCELYVLVCDCAVFAYGGRYAIHPNIIFCVAAWCLSRCGKDYFITRKRSFHHTE